MTGNERWPSASGARWRRAGRRWDRSLAAFSWNTSGGAPFSSSTFPSSSSRSPLPAFSFPAAKAAATWDGTRWARSRSWSGWSVLPTRSRSPPRRRAAPMFDLTLFEKREFALGVVVALVSSFSIVGLELVLSQRLQLVLGYSPLQAAL